jgi:hypothetical protein
VQNAYVESFNGRFRRVLDSLGDLTPDEFEQCTINRAPEPTLSS